LLCSPKFSLVKFIYTGGVALKTTVTLNDELVKSARKISNIKKTEILLNEGLKLLISFYSREKLIAMGGKIKKSITPKRRR